MLDRLAGLTIRRPKAVLAITLLIFLIAGAFSAGLSKRVTAGGYTQSGTQSQRAEAELQRIFGQDEPNLIVLVSARHSLDDPAVANAARQLTAELAAEPGLSHVVSYWTSGKPPALRSRNGDQGLILGLIKGNFDATIKRANRLQAKYAGTLAGLRVAFGGSALTWYENVTAAKKDATKADELVFPLLLIVLILLFGGLVAAAVPMAVAAVTIVVAMALMWVLTRFMTMSNFVVNVTTFAGIGLSLDYTLLMVTRYREQLAHGQAREVAIRAAVRTAGRTVLFSALTVTVAFTALLVFPFTFFTSLALAAIGTALIAGITSVIVVPALLTVFGPRIDKLSLFRRKPRVAPAERGLWRSLATFVMRRPVPVIVASLGLVVFLGFPLSHIKLRLPDEQVLPTSAQAAHVAQALRHNFDTREDNTISLVAAHVPNAASRTAAIGAYAAHISAMPDVARVDSAAGSYAAGSLVSQPTASSSRFVTGDATYLSVISASDPYSPRATHLVREIRSMSSPFPVIVGGNTADLVDTFNTLGDRFPFGLAILAAGMFALLLLLSGSIVIPIKGIVLSTLSLSATLGAIVFIFQEGHLRSLTGPFVVTGGITWTIPIVIFAMAFGISMDYQVFMLGRIKEEYDRTGDNTLAVVNGLARTGRVVTSAAILISMVCVVWVSSGISYMKAFGIGLPLAILMDATVVRGFLLPALMRLLGRANWWAPGVVRRVHRSLRFDERDAVMDRPVTSAETLR